MSALLLGFGTERPASRASPSHRPNPYDWPESL